MKNELNSYWMTSPASLLDAIRWAKRLGLFPYADGSYAPDSLVWRPDEIPKFAGNGYIC